MLRGSRRDFFFELVPWHSSCRLANFSRLSPYASGAAAKSCRCPLRPYFPHWGTPLNKDQPRSFQPYRASLHHQQNKTVWTDVRLTTYLDTCCLSGANIRNRHSRNNRFRDKHERWGPCCSFIMYCLVPLTFQRYLLKLRHCGTFE